MAAAATVVCRAAADLAPGAAPIAAAAIVTTPVTGGNSTLSAGNSTLAAGNSTVSASASDEYDLLERFINLPEARVAQLRALLDQLDNMSSEDRDTLKDHIRQIQAVREAIQPDIWMLSPRDADVVRRYTASLSADDTQMWLQRARDAMTVEQRRKIPPDLLAAAAARQIGPNPQLPDRPAETGFGPGSRPRPPASRPATAPGVPPIAANTTTPAPGVPPIAVNATASAPMPGAAVASTEPVAPTPASSVAAPSSDEYDVLERFINLPPDRLAQLHTVLDHLADLSDDERDELRARVGQIRALRDDIAPNTRMLSPRDADVVHRYTALLSAEDTQAWLDHWHAATTAEMRRQIPQAMLTAAAAREITPDLELSDKLPADSGAQPGPRPHGGNAPGEHRIGLPQPRVNGRLFQPAAPAAGSANTTVSANTTASANDAFSPAAAH